MALYSCKIKFLQTKYRLCVSRSMMFSFEHRTRLRLTRSPYPSPASPPSATALFPWRRLGCGTVCLPLWPRHHRWQRSRGTWRLNCSPEAFLYDSFGRVWQFLVRSTDARTFETVRCPRSLWQHATIIFSFDNNNNNELQNEGALTKKAFDDDVSAMQGTDSKSLLDDLKIQTNCYNVTCAINTWRVTFNNVGLVLDLVALVINALLDGLIVVDDILSHAQVITDNCLCPVVHKRTSQQLQMAIQYHIINRPLTATEIGSIEIWTRRG